MLVLKFGGSSVAHESAIRQVAQIIQSYAQKERVTVVVSAMGGITDLLVNALNSASNREATYQTLINEIEKTHLDAVKSLIPVSIQSGVISRMKQSVNQLDALLEGAYLIGETTPRLSDQVLAYGELLSSEIMAAYLQSLGIDLTYWDARLLIRTNSQHGKAQVDTATTYSALQQAAASGHQVQIMGGFIGSDALGHTTTLGRGGSDYSASLAAAGLSARELLIYTDVSGMFTAHPQWVKSAKPIEEISYEEAMELSHFGAKVLYPPTIQPAMADGIPLRIKNTFAPEDPGTLISATGGKKQKTVRGISHIPNMALVSLEGPGMVGIPGISQKFFSVLSQAQINVVLITQASSEHSITIAIASVDAQKAVDVVNEAFSYERKQGMINKLIPEMDMAILALVGDQMRSHQGLSGKMFQTLGRNNVNIRVIAQGSSERNISAVIAEKDVPKAINALHETFFEAQTKQINLFIMGVGTVGSQLLAQLESQSDYLQNHLQLQVRVVGMANSKTMCFDESGIELSQWANLLAGGTVSSLDGFAQEVKRLNLRNSIFVDNTANAEVANSYPTYLSNSISVVTCNKIACSASFDYYLQLQELCGKYQASFLYETNVGAGLPIIDTIKNMVASGDRIHRIQAVLSGSLNFIFHHYQGDDFAAVVGQAQEKGYTEPDPKIDLSGVDVMRKILILAREAGLELEMSDIQNNSFLSPEALATHNNQDLYAQLIKDETKMHQLWQNAQDHGAKLKYTALLDGQKARVGIEVIPKDHPFFHLPGSDNIVLLYSARYPTSPMVIQGAGAGAAVTASGIFADIIRASKQE